MKFLADVMLKKAGRTAGGLHFLADVMLKKAGRWLRILGFDCEFPESEDDSAILEQAEDRGLVLLTKDVELVARARKAGVRVLHVKKVHNTKQVAEIMHAFKLKAPAKLAPTKCAACNGELRKARKSEVAGKVHERVLAARKSFWLCTSCGHIFWKGSHWEKIEDEFALIKKELAKLK
jgi:hypothetical protein